MRLTPYFLTADGRKDVKDANNTIELQKQRGGIGFESSKNAQKTYVQALEVTRRDFLQKAAAIIGVGAVSATGASVLWNAKEIDEEESLKEVAPEHVRGKKLLQATEELEKTGLCSIEWHHPEGHEGEVPTEDGLIVVSHVHQSPSTGGFDGERHLSALYDDLQILLRLESSGLSKFQFEGRSADSDVKPLRIGDSPESGYYSREEQKEKLSDTDFFKEMFSRYEKGTDFEIVDRSFAAICKKDTSCRGSENPETFPAWIKAVERVQEASKKAVKTSGIENMFDTKTGKVFIVHQHLENGNMRGVEIPHEDYIAIWQEYINAQYAVETLAWDSREQYIAENVHADVLLIGGAHSEGLALKLVNENRSVCICKTNMYQEKEKEVGGIDRKKLLDPTKAEKSLAELNAKVDAWKKTQAAKENE